MWKLACDPLDVFKPAASILIEKSLGESGGLTSRIAALQAWSFL